MTGASITANSTSSASTGTIRSVFDSIVTFYQETWFLKKSWASRQAQVSCIDLAIKGILRMAGQNESNKYDSDGQPVVLCVGLATFNSQTGMPSKHSVLEARLVKKVRTYFECADRSIIPQVSNTSIFCIRCSPLS